MPWKRHRLRDADVWARTDASGQLVQDSGGRVEIVYKSTPGQRVYRAGARNLTPAPGDNPLVEIAVGEPAPESTAKKPGAASTAAAPANAIHVWTDGACTGNPGPCGLGVVVIDGEKIEELSEYLGEGTNNIAELMAIFRGLETVPTAERHRPVMVYTDSQYSIGVVSLSWKAKANVELIARLKQLGKEFKDLRFVKVAGHAGIPLNERVDELARGAITRRR
jgi:ribonuclease HI